MTEPSYHYNATFINHFLDLVYAHHGQVYGGFVRDFIARDVIRTHGLVKGISYPLTWSLSPWQTKAIPADIAEVTVTGDERLRREVAGRLITADCKPTGRPDTYQRTYQARASRIRDLDIWFTTAEHREAFRAAAKAELEYDPRQDHFTDEGTSYTFDVMRLDPVVDRMPYVDLVVSSVFPVNDSPVNLLSYDGMHLRRMEPNVPEEVAKGLPDLGTVLTLISLWTMPIYDHHLHRAFLEPHPIERKGSTALQRRLVKKFVRGWDVDPKVYKYLPETTNVEIRRFF